jgi:hypothetical protein
MSMELLLQKHARKRTCIFSTSMSEGEFEYAKVFEWKSYGLAPTIRPLQHVKFLKVRENGQWHEFERSAIAPCGWSLHWRQALKDIFPKDEATRASKLLELVHSDVCELMKTTSHGEAW